ncbi:MAG: aldehyde dehydrogenase [Nitrospirae bacterium]|uniref:aldehyde dehydrogenase family protein n=1 Tax=Candidatus Magnetobacterium casense TaxID=1455061 RepID=UPI00058FD9EB|nr:aldehyde dehydrogenase family protein [Candidatus Magnetobacterium casensis]MBF0336997.1 aldehyde dehydrogenase [Nitrospirota bacterium]
MKGTAFNYFEDRCLILSRFIKANTKILIEILTDYEPYNVAVNEIKVATDTLDNIDMQKEYLTEQQFNISVFLPINLPLFSIILFAIIPSFFSTSVYVRVPILARNIVEIIFKHLKIEELFSEIKLVNIERAAFIEKYIKKSEVVVFIGKYQNAIEIMKKCHKDTLFLHNGSGINPIVVGKDANIQIAVSKTIKARIFNSGQDCAAPNVIFVDKNFAKDFYKHLIISLKKVKVGSYKNKKVSIGKVIDHENLFYICKFLTKHKDDIVFGGEINFKTNIIHPTVIVKEMDNNATYGEFLAPIFYINVYNKDADMIEFFHSTYYLKHSMYVSVFGKLDFIYAIKKSIILDEKIVLDIENGNYEFGGYSLEASFVAINKEIIAKPILISREIFNHMIKKQLL